jgi:hypothetical protein
MVWLRDWIAEIGVPAAIRPITGMATLDGASAPAEAATGARTRPRFPSITGKRPLRVVGVDGDADSGRRRTSSARARLGSRRIKPRSSSAMMRRWIPDLDLRSSASFISSNEGGTPVLFQPLVDEPK